MRTARVSRQILAVLAALALHALLILFIWQGIAPPGSQIRRGEAEGQRLVAIQLAPPTQAAPAPVARQSRAPAQLQSSPKPLPPAPATSRSGAGDAEVFCFERAPVHGTILYDCVRLWGPTARLDFSLGGTRVAPRAAREPPPVLTLSPFALEDLVERGWIPQTRSRTRTRDPVQDQSVRNPSDEVLGPSPIPD